MKLRSALTSWGTVHPIKIIESGNLTRTMKHKNPELINQDSIRILIGDWSILACVTGKDLKFIVANHRYRKDLKVTTVSKLNQVLMNSKER